MNSDTTNGEIEDVLNQHLATSEIVKSVLTVRSAASSEESGPTTTVGQDVYILAVVSSSENVEEEGSVFIFKPVSKARPDVSDTVINFDLVGTLPLTNALGISMAQSRSRSGTIDLRPGKYDSVSRPAFMLTLSFARRKWVYSTESSEPLGSFVAECRRLINIANVASDLDFRWLNKYHPNRQLPVPTLFPRPDLRSLQKAAHSRLSPAIAGQPGDEGSDMLLILDDWLRTKLQNDKNVFTGTRNFCIRTGTFNVNGKPPSQDLSPWIRPQHTKVSDKPLHLPPKTVSPISLSSFTASDYRSVRPVGSGGDDDALIRDADGEPDMYVLGFQELDLSTEALLYGYNAIREDMWTDATFAALGEMRNQYTKLISKQLVGMLIICIVKNDIVKAITDVRTCTVGTGIMGMMGNKGAVALRLTLHSTVITFVNAHLAAFDEYTERRNADFHDLSRRLLFDSQTEGETSEEALERSSESIFQCDALFWMGDLNYRIDLPDAEVRQLIGGSPSTCKYDIRDLLSHDQLTKARLEGKAFEDFIEGEISDPPYRFSAGITVDGNGYDIKRRPAWTDRVLYQVAPRVRCQQKKYSVHPELTMSDHKPVSAEFCVAVCLADEAAYYNHVRNLAGQIENIVDSEETPKLKVLPIEIRLGDVWYRRKAIQRLTLQNNGKIPCAFRFVSSGEDEAAFPPWLSANPRMGVILPNEELSIQMTIHVDETSAQDLNIGKAKLQHTLTLRTMQGEDHFIVVSGDYKRTCFANDLATLVRLPGPIRQTDSLEEPLLDNQRTKVNAPREVIRLIEWLMTNATDIPDLFLQRGDINLEESIRESLDTGEDFPFDQANQSEEELRRLALSSADVLFELFQSLPSPVIPAVLHERCAQVTDRDEAFEVVSSELPGYVLNVWISLTAFLHFIAQRTADGKDPNENNKAITLACIFAPVLLRDAPGKPPLITPLAKRRFLLHFIQ